MSLANRLAFLACAAGLHGAPAAWATPADLFGFGARSQALAGSGASDSYGYAATYTNPAELSSRFERSFAVGWQAQSFDLGVQTQTGRTRLQDDTEAALVGLAAPLPFAGVLQERLVLGLGATTPGSTIARVRILNASRRQFPLLGTRAEALNLNLGLGARLPWGLQLGLGTRLLASLHGSVQLDTVGEAANSLTDDELVVVQAPVLGVSYRPNTWLSLGSVWRSSLRSEFDLLVTVADLGPIVVPPLHVTGLAQIDPAQWVLEASADHAGWQLSAGLTLKQWSDVLRFKGATVRCPASADAGEASCEAPPAAQLDLRDTWVPRLALERDLHLTRHASAQLRAGYFYEPSPFRTPRVLDRLFDNPRHVLSVGYGVEIQQPLTWRSSVALQWQHLARQRPLTLENDRTVAAAFETGFGQIWCMAFVSEVVF